MKKLLVVALAAFLVSGTVLAQDAKDAKKEETKKECCKKGSKKDCKKDCKKKCDKDSKKADDVKKSD